MTSVPMQNSLFWMYHFIKNDGLNYVIKKYKINQWNDHDLILDSQYEKIFNILNHSIKNVPYYKSILSKKKKLMTKSNLREFAEIPFLTKNIIRNNFKKLVSSSIKKTCLVKNSTSGSTGESLSFFTDANSLVHRQAVVCRNFDWVSCGIFDKKISIWGAPLDVKKYNTLRGHFHSLCTRSKLLSSYNLSDEKMYHYVKEFNKFRPKLLISYPSHLVLFAEFLEKNSIQLPSLQSIITSGESLYPWQREIIERIMRIKIFDRYGSREFGNIAHQCEIHSDYHINAERFYLEIVDEQGKPVDDGEVGELVVTDLDNYGFPFIRYKIGDLASFSSTPCPCGRNLPGLKSIEGRSFDIIQGVNGNRLGGTFWTLLMRRTKAVENFQVIQKKTDTLEIKIVKSVDYSSHAIEEMLNTVHEKLGATMHIDLIYVPSISPTKSGKRKFVVSEIWS
jgi:phenylacetate-CoA ligase